MKKLSRRVKYGSMNTVILAVFLAVVVAVNVLVSLLIDRFPLTIDLTEDSIYQLGEESLTFLDGLDKDVKITVLLDESDMTGNGSYFLQAHESIEQYRLHSNHVTVEYLDLIQNPNLSSLYPDYTLSQGDILVECGERVRHYAITELFNITTDYTTYTQQVTSSKVEQVITSAIMQVTDANPVKVILVEGHGEEVSSSFVELLTLNGYELVTQNILREELDDTADMIVICGPTSDYNAAELEKLDAFLDNGGKLGRQLIIAVAASYTSLPNLDEFLEEWRIAFDSGFTYETDEERIYRFYGEAYPIFYYDDIPEGSPYLEEMTNKVDPIFTMFSHAVVDLGNSGSYETQSVLSTSDTMVIRPIDADENWTPKGLTPQSYNDILLSEKIAYSGTEQYISSVVALSSTELIGDTSLTISGLNNSNFIITVINDLTGKEAPLTLVPKTFLGTTIGLTETWVQRFMIFFVVIVPVAVLAAGLVVYIRRRHR